MFLYINLKIIIMAAKTIYVSRVADTNAVKFRDSEGHKGIEITTDVNPDDYVIWEIDPKTQDVHKLFGIESRSEKSLLKYSPKPVEGAYVGKVRERDVYDGEIEDYAIYYQLEFDGPVLSQDPKLKMNK